MAALRVPGGGELSRGEIDGYTEFVKIYGAKGLAWIKVNDVAKGREGLQSPIVKNLNDGAIAEIIARSGARNGDLLFFGADKAKVVNDSLGALARQDRPQRVRPHAQACSRTSGRRCGWWTSRCSSTTRPRSAGSPCTTRSLHPKTATRT